ncbi:MAG: phytanoyl-CoA dioxygenase family protein [Gammaproteobacteria bacterium]|nr:phytanoyl-CoA dioxygenase family protein [Gammaproteobacteria bacterium]
MKQSQFTPADDWRKRFARDGFLSPIRILDETEALAHRRRMERAERSFGDLHYQGKVYTILRSPMELARHPRVLEVVNALIGPNVLLWNGTYIVKEPRSSAHVSWHQDLAYWGLDGEDQVSVWIALSAANESSGGMRMVPGSHRFGRMSHSLTPDDSNVLYQGQTVADVDDGQAVFCELMPGEASFHHGWTLHASLPNESSERRIGFNAQYVATHMRQTQHDRDTAILVSGVDTYGHFGEDMPATVDFDPAAVARQRELDRQVRETMGTRPLRGRPEISHREISRR